MSQSRTMGTGRDEIERGGVSDLVTVGEGLLSDARNQPARRAARTIVASTTLRATVIALLEGAELSEHASPPAASLQVVIGEVHLVSGDADHVVREGEIVRIPPQRHRVRAAADSVVLLTVALH